MIKSLTALTIMLLLGVSVVALPGFAPQVKANEPAALVKADRLPVRALARDCSRQVWPNFETSCLRDGASAAPIREARLVLTRR